MACTTIPLYENREEIGILKFAHKWLATERSCDEPIPDALSYPAALVSHCVPVARKRHARMRQNVVCRKQVRIVVASFCL